jgi:hypothetical protein
MPERSLIKIAAVLTTVTWVGLIAVRGAKLDLSLLSSLGLVLAVVGFLMGGFERLVWRAPILYSVFRFGPPVIHGTWKGEVRSVGDDRAFEVFLAVTQSLSRVSVRMLMENGCSETLASRWGRSDDHRPTVYYLWRRFPAGEDSGDSPGYIRHGAGLIEVCGERNFRLRGPYWTDQRRSGDLSFKWHRRRVCDSYDEAIELFEEGSNSTKEGQLA